MRSRIIRSKSLDRLCVELWENTTTEQKMRLTPNELRAVRKPNVFVNRTLDEKLIVASKLGKRVHVILIDEKSEIGNLEFAYIFRQTFIDEAKNRDAMELMDGKGMVIVGNETVSRFIQKAELFINSDLYEVAKVIKRMKSKKASVRTVVPDKETDLRELFMHTVLRTHFAVLHMEDHLKSMALSKKEYSILCALYLSARPMTNEGLRDYIKKVMWAVGDQRSPIKHLAMKGYISRVELESTHIKRRAALWMLSSKGHNAIEDFVKKVTDETISNVYV